MQSAAPHRRFSLVNGARMSMPTPSEISRFASATAGAVAVLRRAQDGLNEVPRGMAQVAVGAVGAVALGKMTASSAELRMVAGWAAVPEVPVNWLLRRCLSASP
jgi:hypothetical protein